MVVVKKINGEHVELYCDNMSDLDTPSSYMPSGRNIEKGSVAYDQNGNIAIYNGTQWNQVGGNA